MPAAKETATPRRAAPAARTVAARQPQRAAASACTAGSVRAHGDAKRAFAALAARGAVAYRSPRGGRIASFGSKNANGFPTVFGVLARRVDARCRATWYRVQLPLRPNGVTGWVRARDVAVLPVTTRIVVDLSERRVTLYDRGRVVHVARAAIGTSATPTPTGRYYVNQRLVPSNPNGPFGPGAIGISAFSPVLTGWAQGGPVAIHGTNRPHLIGQAVSNGCIRVRNADLRVLFAKALAGTPVVVRA
ncbi:MAG TPA: L,D-transpeptidase [Gaiellaceae bacterium]|nr:L,D-transpeptidase [Gaiellaceae bacterium]